jgi:hypothetical protein
MGLLSYALAGCQQKNQDDTAISIGARTQSMDEVVEAVNRTNAPPPHAKGLTSRHPIQFTDDNESAIPRKKSTAGHPP